jgi:molecular chaperone DnaJ
MAKRDFYAILGVPARAQAAEIRRAYRRLAFTLHPDVGQNPDPARFSEVHEAYEVLSNPTQRDAYDVELLSGRRSLSAETLGTGSPITVIDDYLTLRPTVEEVVDHISENFFGYRKKSGGPSRRLGIEAILEPEEARFGCRLPLRIPGYAECPGCNGTGESWGWDLCRNCRGLGMIETIAEVAITLRPGTRDGERYEIDLSRAGINNLVLDVRIVVP